MTAHVDVSHLTLLPAHEVATLPWEDLHGTQGVRTKVLWRAAGSLAGLMALEPGAALPPHAHVGGHHHIYVITGRCRVRGEMMPAGSYVHVAAGESHDIASASPEGCEVFYLYLSAEAG